MQDKRVGIASIRGSSYSAGVANIIIPPDVDRDTFVAECLRIGRVSIQPEWNNSIHRVKCDKGVLQQIRFPTLEDDDIQGSQVVFLTMSKQQQPIVIACIDSIVEYGSLDENQFQLSKRTDFGSVSIIGDGKGRLSVSISSEAKKQGLFDISITNPDDSAKLNVNVRGTSSITTSGKTSLLSNAEVEVKVTDGETESYLSITKDEILQISESIKHNSGKEPMLLGQSTIDLLQEFINLVATSIVMGQPLSNAANIARLATQLNSLLSQKSTLE